MNFSSVFFFCTDWLVLAYVPIITSNAIAIQNAKESAKSDRFANNSLQNTKKVNFLIFKHEIPLLNKQLQSVATGE